MDLSQLKAFNAAFGEAMREVERLEAIIDKLTHDVTELEQRNLEAAKFNRHLHGKVNGLMREVKKYVAIIETARKLDADPTNPRPLQTP